jgi:RND family efflux transporter MFP subunit
MATQLPPPLPARRVRAWQVGLLVGLAFTGMLAVGAVPRLQRHGALAAEAEHAAARAPLVGVAKARRVAGATSLDLPGEIRPYQEAALYARTTGYLKRRLVDIGDRVKAGQLLADIESPELEKELGQARATLAQAEARLEEVRTAHALAGTTAARWRGLRKDGSVSAQETDEKQAAYRAKGAEVAAAQAGVRAARQNVARLASLTRYMRVVAPFPGTITARGADPGALIGQGGANAGAPLFRLVQADRLRIVLNVPQAYAASVRPGMATTVAVRELPKPFTGRVARTAGALDPATRTLLAEIELANDGRLLPGMYARVKIEASRGVDALVVPGTAIVTRGGESQVAVVGDDQVVHYRRIGIGRDDGTDVEVMEGLREGEAVVIGPSDLIAEGARVEVAAEPPAPGAGARR